MDNFQTKKIWINGIVQGVGFRPFVYTQAKKHQITGWVRNSAKGVDIVVTGKTDQIESFLTALRNNPPPLARIDHFEISQIELQQFEGFSIVSSKSDENDFIPISPDISICEDCLKELFDPQDHRYRYPFINCTNCGPRFTIIKNIPYDRPFTTMASFPMCETCLEEYQDPTDRRFHAQPVACPDCGPHLQLTNANLEIISSKEQALQDTRQILREGKIAAIKGLGGYHLVCDAKNEQAVSLLRSRKKRSDKPFALMAFDLETVKRYCYLSSEEEQLLTSKERPIVILNIRKNSGLAEQIAPQQNTLGFMLPYTPLHYLLLEPTPDFPDVLVMTSANISDEPIVFKDQDAVQRLKNITDVFLIHNREIHTRVDDSVYRMINQQIYPLRRSRGFAPNSISLSKPSPQILACGAELKNTFCLTRDKYAFLSHHIGDLENLETLEAFESGIKHFEALFRIKPQVIAADLHPNYLATRYAVQRANQENLPLYQIQHHHAHLAACLADNHWQPNQEPVIGLIYDGTGYGTDGAIWGGEVFIGNYQHYQRRFHLRYTPLAGGDLAVKQPARMALAHLYQSEIDWADLLPSTNLCMEERTVLRLQLEKMINAVPTSSMGRLFDAAAALIGIRQKVNYEGQAAIEMENMVDPDEIGYYPFDFSEDILDPTPLWIGLINDIHQGLPIPKLAAKFHQSIANLNIQICNKLRADTGITTVALAGGVWQNKVLLQNTIKLLNNGQFTVLIHKQVPTNDGSVALGQASIAAYTSHS